jgi:hypothetical protein
MKGKGMSKGEHAKPVGKRRVVKLGALMAGASGMVAIAAIGLTQVGSSAFNATVSPPSPLSVNAATLSLVTGATDSLSGASVSNMIPQDYTEQVVNLKNEGTASFGSITLGAYVCSATSATCTPSATTSGNAMITSATSGTSNEGLTITVQSCPTAWTASGTTDPITYTCSSTASTVLAKEPVADITGTNSPAALSLPSTGSALAPSGESYLMFTIALGSAAPNTDQGLANDFTFNFTATSASPGAVA